MTKPEIIICLGSSCFSRGNKEIINEIRTYLKENNLEEKVNFHGAHCFGECSKGPNLKINDKLYNQVDTIKLLNLLEENTGHLKNKLT